jgi:hypothetical protein
MFHQKFSLALIALIIALLPASAQITIDGIADRANYNNSVSYRVQTQAGFTDAAFLNGLTVPVGVFSTITRPDYYELFVHRTNDATSAVTTRLVRFLVNASERGGTEWGLPPHTPFPLVQSSSNEFAGARLRLIAPETFPAGYEIPVVAWVVDEEDHAVRANGLLTAPGHPSIQLRRGVGSGFLAATNAAGTFDYPAQVQGIQTNKTIALESGTVWTTVSGTLNGAVNWPDGARIRVTTHLSLPAGASLTIGPGAIVLLNPGVNITNNGSININGTIDRPVIFMPVSRAQPWGGFFMRTSTGLINATGTIFTGSGADPNGGAGHRSEQCLFLCDSTPRVTLIDSAAIYLAGQLGHAFNGGTFNFTRFLMQRCITGGEYTGANFTVNDSAFIECPDDTANFVDGDNDGLYLVSGAHNFTNTLFGWTKDDGIDSGGDGFARLHYERCWFEASFHEGNSLSGRKGTTAHRTVYMDCGQGIEDGYGAGSSGPTGRVDTCLFLVCKSGVRHGDNYPSIGNGYPGFITATNCILLQNHRDLFGYNWRTTGFTNAWGQFFANNNFLTRPDTNFPDNFVWNPTTDAGRLIEFGAAGRVGVALALRAGQTALTNFPDGVPVALSLFCTNPVSVDYLLETGDGSAAGGTLVFAPGEVRKFIPAPASLNGVLRISLSRPQNADLTGASQLYLQQFAPPQITPLVGLGSVWRYRDDAVDLGTAWRANSYDDDAWASGPAELGFGESDQSTLIASNRQSTTYFRHAFTVENQTAFSSLLMRLKRDDAGVVYLNGFEVYRSPNLPLSPATISYSTLSSAPNGENTIDTATLSASALRAGENLVAVEIHQAALDSSDISFDFELIGQPLGAGARVQIGRFGNEAAVYWSDSTFRLQGASVLPSAQWTNMPGTSPIPIKPAESKQFYRLAK